MLNDLNLSELLFLLFPSSMNMGFFSIAYVSLLLLFISSVVEQVNGKQFNTVRRSNSSGCDLFQGTWVYDRTYPLYDSTKCPFIEREFDCLLNGRPDKLYLKFRWKPTACETPRFDGKYFLEKFRGKKIMFVGDSLSLNQWQSLTCMLHTADPAAEHLLFRTGDVSTFKFPTYNVTVLLFRNAFLVDIVGTKIGRLLKLDSIEASKNWEGVDTLIFNTWHWWLHTGRKQPWDLIQEGTKLYKDMDRLVAYRKALTTWANWVDKNIDPTKTQVYFQGVSPDHANGTSWGEPLTTCDRQNLPIPGTKYPGGPHPAQVVVKEVLSKMTNPVKLLDITLLSQMRKDGHPAVYGHGGHRDLDCSHWCLGGVPDTWNTLFYALFLSSQPHEVTN